MSWEGWAFNLHSDLEKRPQTDIINPGGTKLPGTAVPTSGCAAQGRSRCVPSCPSGVQTYPGRAHPFQPPQPGFEVSFFLSFFLFFFFLFLSSLLFSSLIFFSSSSFLLSFFFLLFVGFVRAERVPHCEPGAVQRSRAPLIAELAPGHRTATAPSAAPRSAAGVGRQRENGAAEPGDGSGL